MGKERAFQNGIVFLAVFVTFLILAKTPTSQAEPSYDESSGSYFEILALGAMNWREARIAARSLGYAGRRGRLAIPRTAETNEFLRGLNLDEPAWIGLRYMCQSRKLQWITGEILSRGDYQNWSPVWNTHGISPTNFSRINCERSTRFLPVHYWPTKFGFTWNANGQPKKMDFIIVEYPLEQ